MLRTQFLFRICLVSFAFVIPHAVFADEEKGEEKEAMELGGLLTVDGANKFKDWENTPATLGTMQISANVHVHENVEGSITLLADNDPQHIAVDQAVGQWTVGNAQIIFGQQYFNNALLSTRMVTDPLLIDLGEFQQAGVTGVWNQGVMSYGLGITSLTTGLDTLSDPCFILNADAAPAGHKIRIASELSRVRQGIDGGANLAFGPFLLDAEALWRWKDDDGVAKGGYSAGVAVQWGDHVQLAMRWDGLGDENDALSQQRIGGGITVTFIEHVFGSGEVAWDENDGAVFAVQMGLQSSLKLPGFQRKTLVK